MTENEDRLQREVNHLKELRLADLKLMEVQRAGDREALRVATEAAKTALIKAEQAYDKRFDLLNEFRGQSEEQQRDFLRKPEYDQAHKALEGRVSAYEAALGIRMGRVETQLATMEGRLLGIVTVLAIVAIAGGVYELLTK